MTTEFRALPWDTTDQGQPRRVGVELEMAGVDLATMAEAVRAEFGGRVEYHGAFLSRVCDTEFADFQIELDARVLQDRRYREHLRNLGIELNDDDNDTLDRWLAGAAGIMVPHEIVAPPLPLAALPRLDRVRADLQQKGARGTQSSLLYAFGLQINIEAHSLTANWILSILKAFVLLYEALVKAGNIDLARQISPYIRPFPGVYGRLILQPDYRPDMGQLIDDYLEHNPTRNRPLDLLPLFAEIDRKRVMAARWNTNCSSPGRPCTTGCPTARSMIHPGVWPSPSTAGRRWNTWRLPRRTCKPPPAPSCSARPRLWAS